MMNAEDISLVLVPVEAFMLRRKIEPPMVICTGTAKSEDLIYMIGLIFSRIIRALSRTNMTERYFTIKLDPKLPGLALSPRPISDNNQQLVLTA